MMTWEATGALVCWLIALPLQLWALVGGPALAAHAALGLLVVGIVLFTAWATAGGIPPMYRY